MSWMLIVYIDIGFFAYATEDQHKVVEAVQKVLPENYIDKIKFKKKTFRGHYGNPITLFETRIKSGEIIQAFIRNFSLRLNEIEKKALLNEINLHVADGNLYVRLDKQAAFQGKFKLYAVDHIRIRIRFKKKKTEEIIQTCQELGIIPLND